MHISISSYNFVNRLMYVHALLHEDRYMDMYMHTHVVSSASTCMKMYVQSVLADVCRCNSTSIIHAHLQSGYVHKMFIDFLFNASSPCLCAATVL